MNSDEIYTIAKYMKLENFLGVFASDQLDMITDKSEGLLVFNTDTSDNIGQHWISMYLSKKQLMYFDSLASEFYKSNFIRSLFVKLGKDVFINKVQTQTEQSDKCGVHALVFCLIMSKNGSVDRFENFLKSFLSLKIGEREILSLEYFDILINHGGYN